MKISKKEFDKEKEHLNKTLGVIKEIIECANVDIEEYKNSIVENKKLLWQNMSDYKDAEMFDTMNNSDFNVHLLNKDIVKVYKLERSLETPYFSRIDFESDGEVDAFYIGLTGVDKDFEPLVYDWRAPISNLYYNYGVGPSKYEIEGHSFEGNTLLKRQFTIKMGTLVDAYDSVSGVTDDILESVLEENTTPQMKNIVNTIQKEQNDIIRYKGTHHLVVEGIAGSGKTSVALHRIAYLLYNEKDYNSNNMLIFSPSEVFTEYISQVIPELGEENVLSTTFQAFAENYIKNVKVESLIEFIERYYETKVDEHKKNETKEKMSLDYKAKIDAFLEEYYESLRFKKKIGLKKQFIRARELNELKSSIPKNISFKDRMELLSEKICAKFKIDEVKNSSRMMDVIYKTLEIETNPLKLYELFTKSEFNYVLYEDIVGILYLYFEVVGYPSMSHIRAVVIDEAQDYFLWQFELLKKIFNRAIFTILGDNNQAINPYLNYNSLEEIANIFKDSKYKRLDKTYRSSKEIVEYSNKILGLESEPIRALNGYKVIEKSETDLKNNLLEDISRFKSHGFQRIAIVTKNDREVEKIKSFHIDEGVSIIPVYLSKGLEYDAVIVYTDKDDVFLKTEQNLFYVAVTRALHELVVYNQ